MDAIWWKPTDEFGCNCSQDDGAAMALKRGCHFFILKTCCWRSIYKVANFQEEFWVPLNFFWVVSFFGSRYRREIGPKND